MPQVSASSVNSSKGLRNRMTTCSCVGQRRLVSDLSSWSNRGVVKGGNNVAASNDLPAFFGWKKG